MGEPFVVPENIPVIRVDGVGPFIRVSDLPALCKAEAMAALKAKNARLQECGYIPRGFDLSPQDGDYLFARFPEAAPEVTRDRGAEAAKLDYPYPKVTPSAGERCACDGAVTDPKFVHTAERCYDHTRFPTPTEGERVYTATATNTCVVMRSYSDGRLPVACCFARDHTGPHSFDVPTPSAGEEGPCLNHVVRENGDECVKCGRVFSQHGDGTKVSDRVSAGETKPCCDPENPNWHRRDCPKWGQGAAVGARPEGENQRVPWPRKNANGGYDYRCQSCACERCTAREAFVNLIADALGRNDNRSFSNRLDTYGGPMLAHAACILKDSE